MLANKWTEKKERKRRRWWKKMYSKIINEWSLQSCAIECFSRFHSTLIQCVCTRRTLKRIVYSIMQTIRSVSLPSLCHGMYRIWFVLYRFKRARHIESRTVNTENIHNCRFVEYSYAKSRFKPHKVHHIWLANKLPLCYKNRKRENRTEQNEQNENKKKHKMST